MDKINVKDWLWRYRRAKMNVRRLQGEYEELASVQESVGAVTYDGMPHSGENHDLSDLMVMRDRAISNLIKANHRMTVAYDEITEAIGMLDSEVKRAVISLRYIQTKNDYQINTLADVAEAICYEYSYIRRVHGEALQDLRSIIPQINNHTKKAVK